MAPVSSASHSQLPTDGEDGGDGGDGGEARRMVLTGVFLVVDGVLALSLVILGILLWNHCPSEPALARCIVASGAFSLFLVLFSLASLSMDLGGSSSLEREDRQNLVAATVCRLTLALLALGAFIALLAYVIKLGLMDDRMVKCSGFMLDLSLTASILGIAQTLLTAVVMIMALLRCVAGGGGSFTGIDKQFKNLFGEGGIEDKQQKSVGASTNKGQKGAGSRRSPAAKYEIHIEPKRQNPAVTSAQRTVPVPARQPPPVPPQRGIAVATVEPQQHIQRQPPKYPSGLENSLEISSQFI